MLQTPPQDTDTLEALTGEEHRLRALSLRHESEAERAARLEATVRRAADAAAASAANGVAMMSLSDAEAFFKEMRSDFPEEYWGFGIQNLAGMILLPHLGALFRGWDPLADPSRGAALVRGWRGLLVQQSTGGWEEEAAAAEGPDVLEAIFEDVAMPALRTVSLVFCCIFLEYTCLQESYRKRLVVTT